MFVYSFKFKKSAFFLLTVLSILVFVFYFGSYILTYENNVFLPANAESKSAGVIVLDAGHGGEDSGTVAADGTYEKDLNLQMTVKIGQMLSDQGFTVVYTRTTDTLLYGEEENVKGLRKISDLKNRVKIADEYPDGLFVSVHMNSFSSSKCEGLQVYYGMKNEKSQMLASSIQSAVVRDLQNDNKRQVKSGNDIYVLENALNEAVLIECGFLSNESECQKLKDEDYQKKLSFAIVCGIVEYINGK